MQGTTLVTRIRTRLMPGDGLRPIVANTGWLMADNVLRMALGVLVGAWVARYLGPERFGELAYALALVWAYRRYPAPASWSWRIGQAGQLLRESCPFLLSGLAIIVYMRIDQIMLREMVGEHELGIYSAALPLSTVWYFIPMAICASVAPALARKKARSETEYMVALERLFSLMWWYSLPLCIGVALLSGPLIGLLYGPAYAASAAVLAVHVFANVPVALGVAQSQWIANERRSTLALYKTIPGAVCNVLLNRNDSLPLDLELPLAGALWATDARVTEARTPPRCT